MYNHKPLNELGLEPWDDHLNTQYLLNKYKKKRLSIKSVLLDQSIITGIGNIYADEILFLSHLNPLTPCMDLTQKDCANIIQNTQNVLERAIQMGGTTIVPNVEVRLLKLKLEVEEPIIVKNAKEKRQKEEKNKKIGFLLRLLYDTMGLVEKRR